MTIKVKYLTIDGFRRTNTYKTLAGARKFAHERVGENPDMGSSYAVSFDGVGRITVEGCTLAELFPVESPYTGRCDGQDGPCGEDLAEAEAEWYFETGVLRRTGNFPKLPPYDYQDEVPF